MALVLSSAVLWGTVGVATQGLHAVATTTALSVGFFRLGFAAPALLVAAWLTLGRRSLAASRRDVLLMAVMGLLLAAYQVCFFGAVPRLGVGPATLVCLGLAPALVAAISAVALREWPSRGLLLALAGALVGMALVVGGGPAAAGGAVRTGGPGSLVAGGLLALAGAVGYGLFTLASRAVAGTTHPVQSTAVAMTVGSLALLPALVASGPAVSYPVTGWALLVYLGLVPTALGYGLFLRGVRDTPATVASVATLAEPLTATALAWALLGERLTAAGMAGALLLLAAIAFLARVRG